jgi:aminoglycoside phosphotransferase (APT) family kinase protein
LNAHDPVLTLAADVAKTLLAAPAEVEYVSGGGRNSRIYKVRCREQSFALKQYPSRADDPRDRLGTEVSALQLMQRYGIEVIPRVMAVDGQRNFVLLSWIDGALVDEVGDTDIDAAAAFLSLVHALRHVPEAAKQPSAAEACLSGREVERQLRARLALLERLGAEEPDLGTFLAQAFAPACTHYMAEAKTHMRAYGLDFVTELAQERRSLVPADFGFHNSLRRGDGSLAYVDFEYFGWDDPVKLTADILLHPGVPLGGAQQRRFRDAAERLYGEDTSFAVRLEALLPLFGLRWILILLNEFLPERWQRRVVAGTVESWSEAKTRQLDKARNLLARLA